MLFTTQTTKMSTIYFKTSFLKITSVILLLFFISSCQKNSKSELLLNNDNVPNEAMASKKAKPGQADKSNTFYGPQVQMGNGKARSFFTVSNEGVPLELGIEMTDGALSNLPEEHDLAAFVIPLHQKAQAATPFDHVVINWNEHGHPPFQLFSEPHFDFHFYTMSLADRMAIPTHTPGDLHDVLPAQPYWPAGFVPTPGGVAQMGKHWVDILNPVAPGSFTYTMIYGSYNGAFNFIEPMITRAFLQSGAEVSTEFGQPLQFGETNTYYPRKYNIRKDAAGKHYISLSSFVLR